jgi:hypothetical protein
MKIEKGIEICIGKRVFRDEVPEKFVTDALRSRYEIKEKAKKKAEPSKKADK